MQLPLYSVGGQGSFEGSREWYKTIEKSLGRFGVVGGYPLLESVEKYLRGIKSCNSILLISSSSPADIKALRKLEKKYPELLPLSYDELMSYSYPLIYFAKDAKTNLVRGIIISHKVDNSLTELLLEKGVPLETPLKYETVIVLKSATKKRE